MNRKRYYLLDEFRGLLVVNMVVFHTIWDLVFMFGNNWQWYIHDRQGWRLWIGANFVLLSGFCWKMSKNPLKRGLIVYVSSMLVSMVTILFTPNARIQFGVLTLIGSCMLLTILLDQLLDKFPSLPGAVISLCLFFLTFGVNKGYLGLANIPLIKLPQEWYCNWFTTYLGLPENGFFSSDYYTIFPWLFMFLTGYFLYRFFEKYRSKKGDSAPLADLLTKSLCPPLGFIGRHALVIYLLHQPIIYGLLSIYYSFK